MGEFFIAVIVVLILVGGYHFISYRTDLAIMRDEARDVPLTTPPSDAPATAVVVDPFNFSLPWCREVFTGVLTAGQEYDITITGVMQRHYERNYRIYSSDALYYQDSHGNFTEPHKGLSIDTMVVHPPDLISANQAGHRYAVRGSATVRLPDLISADRELHRYMFRFGGKGEKLALCFSPYYSTESQYFGGTLSVSVQETAAGNKFSAKAEAERQTRIQKLILELEALKRHEPDLADPAYLEKYAARNKNDLLKRRAEITQKNLAFRANVLPLLEEQGCEDLIPFGEWERKALAIAARLDVEPGRRPKPTVDEVRRQIVGRVRVKAEDKIEKTRVLAEVLVKARTVLDGYDLDPDERQQLEQELIESILSEEDDNGDNTKVV